MTDVNEWEIDLFKKRIPERINREMQQAAPCLEVFAVCMNGSQPMKRLIDTIPFAHTDSNG
jgi:hypothetical protein